MSSEAPRSRPAAVGRQVDRQAMRAAFAQFLTAAGLPEPADSEAPRRATDAWVDSLLSGYDRDPLEVLQPTWPEPAGEMIAISGIPFVSVCAHHLLPFFGRAWVAYLPGAELTGLSRVEELVRCLSRRLQLQETLGEQVAATLMAGVAARGAACVLEAEHLCVFARGKRQRGTLTRSVAYAGEFADNDRLQRSCLMLLGTSDAQGRGAADHQEAGE